jgi:hypothetical protein
MRARRAEQRHGGVADMFVDRAAETLDDGVDERENRSSNAWISSGSSLAERLV